MPLEKGGRADKAGNRYEIKAIIYELLNLINETTYSVVVEALGEDEVGTDILVTYADGVKEHQQCKARNASKEYWRISDLEANNVFKTWKYQLNRGENRQVALISPVGCGLLVDLHERALNTSENPRDFYDVQIRSGSKQFREFYQDFCTAMNLDLSNENDIIESISLLKRIKLKDMSEYVIKESIYQKIEHYFCSDKNDVYNALVTFVIDGDILGKEVTVPMLFAYFTEQKIDLRLMHGDKRLVPLISTINQEYRNSFKPLKEGLIQRNEFLTCIDAIKNERNLIISGNAGYGKSGCAEAILDYCENEKIPFIAIKLDRKIPQKNCEEWGKILGFPSSISYALNVISKSKKAVIILDQLDALRWTQANSSEALSVCMELIRQVRYLNYERKYKIAIVFVCRSYDLENDNNIKALFKTEPDINESYKEWTKVIVQNFDEDTVQNIIGENYKKLNVKTKQLLQVPSNLYIWQHLDEKESCNDCITTSHLIEKWYQQICRRSITVGVQENAVIETKEHVVSVLDRMGRLYAPKKILKVEEIGFDYLVSVEMLVVDGNRVGFVHQSILDYFISERMMQQYFADSSIEDIIGEKQKQTPTKRYQIQMFLQNLLEYDTAFFVIAGKKMLESKSIRYYVKSVFHEILRQVVQPDENLKEVVIEGCKNNLSADYWLNNVVFGNHEYITALGECGILEKWFADDKRKNTVFALFQSIAPDLDIDEIAFIRNHALKNEEDDKKFISCFWHDIVKESDSLFELRMLFYCRYPEWAQELYINIKSMMKNCEKRTIRLISFWLKNKITSDGKKLYRYEDELIDERNSFLIENGCYVLDELLQYVPEGESWQLQYGDWSGKYGHNSGLERATVEIIKKANKAIINQNPKLFWDYFEPYMGKNYTVYNEIILQGLTSLPSSYSNRVISYLASDLEKNIFDYTSGAEKQLGLAIEVIKVHATLCEIAYLHSLEDVIIKYVSSRAAQWYKSRIEQNKITGYAPVYWSFWGDLQYQILQSIPYERLSCKSKSLLSVLERKFEGKSYRYSNSNGHYGGVASPISGKTLRRGQWLQIITNKKLKNRDRASWKEVPGGFIESSLEMYSSDFSSAVKLEPVEMIQLVLENKDEVVPIYIDSMYSGAAFSENIDKVSQQIWEEMFRSFPCDLESYRATYFCTILEKANNYVWSSDVLSQLKNIAINFNGRDENTDLEEEPVIDCEKLIIKSLNCVRGDAARAIGHLLWNDKNLFSDFKTVIDKLTLDDDLTINMASLYAIWPSYNIDREWAETRILHLYELDIRMAGFQDSRGMFFRLFPKYKERILTIISKCFESGDKTLVQRGGYSICEFYMRHDEFEEVIIKIEELNEEQVNAILCMAVIYLKYEEDRDKAKSIILEYKNSDCNVEMSLSRMFYDKLVDVERDSAFLLEIMCSKVSGRVIGSFVEFLEEEACSIRDYAEIILSLCKKVLSMNSEDMAKQWGIDDNISKLIIALYDEVVNSEREIDKLIAEDCLELWDVMFEKQIGRTRELSRKLMER